MKESEIPLCMGWGSWLGDLAFEGGKEEGFHQDRQERGKGCYPMSVLVATLRLLGYS